MFLRLTVELVTNHGERLRLKLLTSSRPYALAYEWVSFTGTATNSEFIFGIRWNSEFRCADLSETQLSLHRLREDLLQQLKHLERQMHHGVVGARETAAVWVRSQENSLKDLRQELVHRLDAITGPTGVP